jgi:hypothetical protein
MEIVLDTSAEINTIINKTNRLHKNGVKTNRISVLFSQHGTKHEDLLLNNMNLIKKMGEKSGAMEWYTSGTSRTTLENL